MYAWSWPSSAGPVCAAAPLRFDTMTGDDKRHRIGLHGTTWYRGRAGSARTKYWPRLGDGWPSLFTRLLGSVEGEATRTQPMAEQGGGQRSTERIRNQLATHQQRQGTSFVRPWDARHGFSRRTRGSPLVPEALGALTWTNWPGVWSMPIRYLR